MQDELILGSLIIAVTVVTHTIGLLILTIVMAPINRRFHLQGATIGQSFAMVATVLGLFAIHAVEIWTWAAAYVWLGALPDLATALYFSTVTFSTLGYGDVILPIEWRLFGGMEGISGFLLIGWSTAYLVAASTRYGPFRTGEHF